MHLLRLTTFAGLTAGAAIDSQPKGQQRCVDPVTRTEWRDLTPAVQRSYIDAVYCMKAKPSRIGLTTSLLDDFPFVHQSVNLEIHFNAHFLPWHRYFTSIYERALRECGYKGAATYWDWTLDVSTFYKSPVLSSDLGFGGDGSDTRLETLRGESIRCVDTGPFSKLRPSYITDSQTSAAQIEHCLSRDILEGAIIEYCNGTAVDLINKEPTFGTFHFQLEQRPHGAVHVALGGDMSPATSPNDPLFFLHHTQIDRLWWKWQQENLSQREFDYSGPAVAHGPDGQIIYGANGRIQYVNATLDDELSFGGLAENIRVRDVMSTNDRMCYIYAN